MFSERSGVVTIGLEGMMLMGAFWGIWGADKTGSWVWGGVLANFTPGHQATWVDYSNDERAPLLIVAGGADHIMPPAVNQANARKYDGSAALTAYHEFPGRPHYTVGQEGWEAVADYALDWAVANARSAVNASTPSRQPSSSCRRSSRQAIDGSRSSNTSCA